MGGPAGLSAPRKAARKDGRFELCIGAPAAPGQGSATFTVQLDAGPTLLHTWFDDARDQPLCGAYYVYVERQP